VQPVVLGRTAAAARVSRRRVPGTTQRGAAAAVTRLVRGGGGGGLRVGEQVLVELVLPVEALAAQRAAERATVDHPVLDQVRPRRKHVT